MAISQKALQEAAFKRSMEIAELDEETQIIYHEMRYLGHSHYDALDLAEREAAK